MPAREASASRSDVGSDAPHVETRDAVYRLVHPAAPAVPVVFESPHSGRDYPTDFATALPATALRRAEDAYVDDLLASTEALGIARLEARFPRAYIDVNRAEDDLDPELLAEPWPTPLRPGPKTALGIGLVRRLVTPELPLYDRRLAVAEVQHRIETYWRPYRARLETLVREHARAHGRLLIVQWHSMKAVGNAATPDGPGAVRADVVLGDRQGRSAPPAVTAGVASAFEAQGLTVSTNAPYAGTPILEATTQLAPGVAALQVELNRGLYLDEARVVKHDGFADLQAVVLKVSVALADLAAEGW